MSSLSQQSVTTAPRLTWLVDCWSFFPTISLTAPSPATRSRSRNLINTVRLSM
jgi:hypothetical protein